jgi:spermidine synthase
VYVGCSMMVNAPRSADLSPASGLELRPRGLFALFFALGAHSLVAQSILFRELLLLVRGSELVFGVFFGAWLFWIGVGAAIGGRVATPLVAPGRSLRRLTWVGVAAPMAAVLLVRSGQTLLGVPVGVMVSFSASAALVLVVLAPFGLLVGATFPLGCCLVRQRSSRGIGHLYMVEALGAVVGGVLFSLVLVGRVHHLPILFVGALVVAALVGWVPDTAQSKSWPDPESDHAWKPPVYSGIIVVVLLPFLVWVGHWDELARRAQLRTIAAADEIAATFDTPYEQVALTRLAEQYTLYGDGQLQATFPDEYETPAEAYALVAQKPDAERVLILGNATTGLAQALVRALDERPGGPYARVFVVAPDRRVVEAIRPFLSDPDRRLLDERVQIIIDDPRAYLQATSETFDLIYLDLPDPTTVYLNRFYTVESFQAARAALTARGVLAYRLTSASAYAGNDVVELAISVRLALARVFPHLMMSAGDNSYYFASAARDQLVASPEAVDARLRELPGADRFRLAIVLDYAAERVQQLEKLMALAPAVVANRDDQPTSYFFGTLLWERFSGDRASGVSWLRRALDRTRAAGHGLAAGVLLLLGGLWTVLGRRRGAQLHVDVALSVFVAGGSAMALNLVLLVHYQSACGALYERLALMSGLFMLGLAAGSALAAGLAPRVLRPALFFAGTLAALAVTSLVLASALPILAASPGFARQLAYAAAFLLAGAVLGTVFPAAAQVLLRVPGALTAVDPTAPTGGLIDAMDHFGAMLGALAVGSLILPALGTTMTLLFVAAQCVGVAGLWLARVRWA